MSHEEKGRQFFEKFDELNDREKDYIQNIVTGMVLTHSIRKEDKDAKS